MEGLCPAEPLGADDAFLDLPAESVSFSRRFSAMSTVSRPPKSVMYVDWREIGTDSGEGCEESCRGGRCTSIRRKRCAHASLETWFKVG